VAAVTASAARKRVGRHDDIAVGHDSAANVRPARAGFIQFLPSPPKPCLTTAMANPAAAAGTYQGAPGGRERPSSCPVSTARPASIVKRRRRPAVAAAAATAAPTATASTIAASAP